MSEPNTGHSCNIAMTTAWSHAVSWLSQTPCGFVLFKFNLSIIQEQDNSERSKAILGFNWDFSSSSSLSSSTRSWPKNSDISRMV